MNQLMDHSMQTNFSEAGSEGTSRSTYFGIRINPSPLTIIFNLSLRGFKVFLSNFFPNII